MLNNDRETLREIINECLKKSPCEIDILFDEPMSEHTTFKTGGKADCFLRPKGEGFPKFCANLISSARAAGVPVFFLGGGANIVVSDNGLRGIVLDTGEWRGQSAAEDRSSSESLVFNSGTSMDEAADYAAALGLSGLEFLAGMPGSVGGAVWMNARCYGSEIADVLAWAEILDFDEYYDKHEPVSKRITVGKPPDISGFSYKQSPFQKMNCLILSACFKLKKADKNQILLAMEKNRNDRREKGHYLFPCAGSAFKNNRDFGKPTGKIIDELGLRGFQIGGAQIAPFHGNIVINTGGATSADIRTLMDEVAKKLKTATGFVLEPEVLFVGEW